jgi:hypothetical protein
VVKQFRKLQKAVVGEAEWPGLLAAATASYPTFRGIPPSAFPLFLTSKAFLRMLDGTLGRGPSGLPDPSRPQPFFARSEDGSILQVCPTAPLLFSRLGGVRAGRIGEACLHAPCMVRSCRTT